MGLLLSFGITIYVRYKEYKIQYFTQFYTFLVQGHSVITIIFSPNFNYRPHTCRLINMFGPHIWCLVRCPPSYFNTGLYKTLTYHLGCTIFCLTHFYLLRFLPFSSFNHNPYMGSWCDYSLIPHILPMYKEVLEILFLSKLGWNSFNANFHDDTSVFT